MPRCNTVEDTGTGKRKSTKTLKALQLATSQITRKPKSLSVLAAHQESRFPFYSPRDDGGPNYQLLLPTNGRYVKALRDIGLESVPPGWVLLAQYHNRPPERQERAKTNGAHYQLTIWMYRLSHPILKRKVPREAVQHFTENGEHCECFEHKRMRAGLEPVKTVNSMISVFAGCPVDIDNNSSSADMVVKASNISRIGVIAGCDLPAGHPLGMYTGETLVSEEETILRLAEYKRGGVGAYIFMYPKGEKWVDATFSKCPAKFVNHSCSPNCLVRYSRAKDGLEYVTRRKIRKGTELTIYYGFTAPAGTPDSQRTKCTCGSKHCRGWLELIEGEEGRASEQEESETDEEEPDNDRDSDYADN